MRACMACACVLFAIVLAVAGHCAETDTEPVAAGLLYLGENLPGRIPKVFAPGIISDAGYRLHGPVVFSPDQREICWSVIPPAVMSMSLVDSIWSEAGPMPLAGSGVHAPAFSADGTRLYYQCVMKGGQGSVDIWWTDRTADGWSAPVSAGPALNSDRLESQPCVTADGTLYYTGTLDGAGLNRGIYRSRIVDGEYSAPELLGGGINTEYIDYCPWIAPDEDYLLFASSRPRSDEVLYLHVSFHQPDGSWSEPVNIHHVLGFKHPARFPSVSPDGRFLFFLSEGQVYWVDITGVMELRQAREVPVDKQPHN